MHKFCSNRADYDRKQFRLSPVLLATAASILLAIANSAIAEDCNDNGVEDAFDISSEASLDCGNNGIPDECEPAGVCVSACDLVVVDENFDGHGIGGNPDDWFDTEIGSATNENDTLFRAITLNGQEAFSTDLPHVNIHSHFVGPDGIAGTIDDNLRLLPGSPAIDRGSIQYLPNDIDTDLDDHDRIVDDPRTPYFTGPFGSAFGILDMGAYEFVLGDCDVDGDTDIADHVILDGCLTNPGDALGNGCACLDLDSDGDVDLRDFGFFQMAFIP